MKRWTAGGRALALAAGLLQGAALATAQTRPLEWSGSVKSVLLSASDATGEGYTLSLNRLRVEAKGEPAPGLALDLQYDNELLLGSYLDTAEFRFLKSRPAPQYLRAESSYLDRGDAYGRHRLHRAALTLSRAAIDLKLGRQRIAWGTGRFWSPIDILNPVSPLAIEREERVGVDAALLEAQLGPLSRASLVYAPERNGPASLAMQWHGNRAGVDVSLTGGRLRGLSLAGVDLAGQIGEAGARAELARLKDGSGRPYSRWMLGLDYAFANGLTLSGELYRNGGGAPNPADYDFAALRAGRITSLATRYAGLFASYEITPLLKWVSEAVLNVDDRSRALDSRLVWSVLPSMELTAGLQRRFGRAGTEYAGRPAAFQLQLQWYFRR